MHWIKRLLTLFWPMLLRQMTQPKPGTRNTSTPARIPPSRTKTRRRTPVTSPAPSVPKPSPRPVSGERLGRKQPGTGRGRRGKRPPLADLHDRKRSGEMVTASGTVVKLLPDDNIGSRHQRLLVEVDATDITIKLAHNIDLAPRIPASEGDRLTFRGEYQWNELGGAIHWTHHDPKQWREGGWVDAASKRYE